MRLKSGVRIGGLRPEMCVALMAAESAYLRFNEELVVTCAVEGVHMAKSLHYVGAAIDLRLPAKRRQQIARNIRERLGEDYDVVLDRSHIHIEFQPKGGINIDAS